MARKRLIDGVWQKDFIKPGYGMRSRILRQENPSKKEYKKMLKKGVPVPLVKGENVCPTCGQVIPQQLPPVPPPGTPPLPPC
jgi:hypothetical protein